MLHFLPSWSEGVDTGGDWLVGAALGVVVGFWVVGVSAVEFPAAVTLPTIMNVKTSAIFILKNILLFLLYVTWKYNGAVDVLFLKTTYE